MKTLKRCKHKKFDFFIADNIAISNFRDEIISMEYPFFALKGGDTKIREYKKDNITVTIRPSAGIGLATIFDKDIWIYAISKLQSVMNNNKNTNRTIFFTPYNFFIATNRSKSGVGYKELVKALARLKGTTITTNIVHPKNYKITKIFSLIEKATILEEKKGNLNIGMIQISLPDWLYQAIKKAKVLKINPNYFLIRKAIDRRLYQIARKHCGNQNEFKISLKKLYLKTGSTANIDKFRFNIKKLEKLNNLPDYKIFYIPKKDNIIFTNRNKKTNIVKYLKKYKKNKKLNFKVDHKLKDNKKKIITKSKFLKKNLKVPQGFRI